MAYYLNAKNALMSAYMRQIETNIDYLMTLYYDKPSAKVKVLQDQRHDLMGQPTVLCLRINDIQVLTFVDNALDRLINPSLLHRFLRFALHKRGVYPVR